MGADPSPDGPPRESLREVFRVRAVEEDDDRILYFGQPLVPGDRVVERVWEPFREAGYEVRFTTASRVDLADGDGTTTEDAAEPRGTVSDPSHGGRTTRRNPDGGPRGSDPPGRSGRDRRPMDGSATPSGRGDREPAPAEHEGGTGDAARPGRPSTSGTEYVLVAEPVNVGIDGVPWTQLILFLATVVSTMLAGSVWYFVDPVANPMGVLKAWPFAAAVLGVLAVHELGHYVMSRYHGVEASLPYFIPLPLTFIGTMGAVIRMKGRMPDRKALFDIGVAGPLAGLVATVVVTAVGLFVSPVAVPESVVNSANTVQVRFGFPPLMFLIAWATGQPLAYGQGMSIHPVVIGGWVGMFVTFLNMIPVGQLDGGHVFRAIVGDRMELVAAFVPAVMFGLAGYLYFLEGVSLAGVSVWGFWGLFSTVLALVGPARPVDDESLGAGRIAVGILAVVLGALCFTPVPVEIIG